MAKQEDSLIPIKCTYSNCSKLLSSKYNLRRHIKFCHQGFRPFECSICYKRFSSKQNKIEHYRLQHSYSMKLAEENNVSDKMIKIDIEIPKLTILLRKSYDPDIRPLSKIERLYLYPDKSQLIYLSGIGIEEPCEVVLPSFAEIDKV
ncbi:hypothetical protein SteCoe_10335 [Stentor coeruleus]|uniref:C2H2-type domain-containing protein n=1 Tax=Stentor coeruleus TaxID=5963 RepID=A0A1R2CFQ0_9CILI|nr:hypothetical protein SteCoe_10335 [Stentor coeruleus]